MRRLRVAMAQINTFVGDLEFNRERIVSFIDAAEELQADIVSFPELAVTGYPPEDLVYKPQFVEDNLKELNKIAELYPNTVVAVGFVDKVKDKLYNAAAVLHEGKVQAVYHKQHLPNYGVFDEKRYFEPGTGCFVFELNGVGVAVNICEDIWFSEPTSNLAKYGGAELIINVNSSPYSLDKFEERQENLAKRSKENKVYIAYNNLVGGQDELVFDGGAMIFNPEGELTAVGKRFEEDLVVKDIEFSDEKRKPEQVKDKEITCEFVIATTKKDKPDLAEVEIKTLGHDEEVYEALVLGVKDYVHKNRFTKALVSLSGGIDSALSLAIAADALGSENLIAVYQPSAYSSKESEEDAFELAKNLGVKIEELSITGLYEDYLKLLEPFFKGAKMSEAEENIQARIRGNIAMAFSNKFGYIVLSTGNKSELSVGYATLYGDMAGGFAVLKDVYKTEVYHLAEYRNSIAEVIPKRIITKPPSAELRPDQKDQDTLPDYETLDAILKLYIEEFKTAKEIIDGDFENEVVFKTVHMVDANEYKRRQAPPGIKITPRAFGRDRRMPMTQGYIKK